MAQLKAWPNGLGYDFGSIEISGLWIKDGAQVWQARDTKSIDQRNQTIRYGRGATYKDALANMRRVPIG